MFRSRAPRSAVAAALSIALIASFMVGTTSAAVNRQASDRAAPAAPKPKPSPTPTPTPVPTPTPTPPNSDTRTVYFGDPDTYPAGDRLLVPSIVTAGNTFAFDLRTSNLGSQNLTHAEIHYGSLADPDRPGSTTPSLPAGATIGSVTADGGVVCTLTADHLGAKCDVGSLEAGETVVANFIVDAPDVPVSTATWASFKVAETPPDQGANRNTFYADASLVVGATNSNGNATYKLGNENLTLSTAGQTLVKKDSMTTTVSVPGASGGAISISETDCDASCDVGQIATVHVRDGADQTPNYLLWTLVVVGSIDGTVTHVLDDPALPPVEISESCSATLVTNCIESNVKNGNVSTIVFRTPTNGKVHN